MALVFANFLYFMIYLEPLRHQSRFCCREAERGGALFGNRKTQADIPDRSTDLVEVISDNLPNSRPLQPDAVHVVVRNLHDFLQAEHSGLMCRGELVHGHRTQPADKVHCTETDTQCMVSFSNLQLIPNSVDSPIAFPSSRVEPVKILETENRI